MHVRTQSPAPNFAATGTVLASKHKSSGRSSFDDALTDAEPAVSRRKSESNVVAVGRTI